MASTAAYRLATMTEYRESHPACPACLERRLEPAAVPGRLSCGTCNGLWLAFDDLARTMDGVVGWAADATIVGDAPGRRACPTCAATLRTCRLRTAPLVMRYGRSQITLDRCEHHGVWLDGGELAGLIAETTATLGELRDETELARPFRWIWSKLRGRD